MVGMEPPVPPRPDERPSRFDWEGADWTPLPTRRRRRGAALVATLVACALVAAAIAGGVTATKTIAPKGSSRDYKFLAVGGGERAPGVQRRCLRGGPTDLVRHRDHLPVRRADHGGPPTRPTSLRARALREPLGSGGHRLGVARPDRHPVLGERARVRCRRPAPDGSG